MIGLGNDLRKFKAKKVDTDPGTDVALLKIDENNLPSVNFADSDKARAGDIVLAIGNPFGLRQTVTIGIISAVGRGGIGIVDSPMKSAPRLNLPRDVQGAVIADIDAESPAAKSGLREGDVIQEVNKQPLKSAKDLLVISKKLKPNEKILMRVYSQGRSGYVALEAK
jgi:S1-C subfamily serine protease